MDDLIEFRVTFGVQYNDSNTHPDGWPHKDGWWAVFAENEDDARELVSRVLGNRWSFIYPPESPRYPRLSVYPRGELRRDTVIRVVDNG